ncbi:gustatory and odorant receptor 63a-like [Zootermopsis nevadensis]|uniref:gustatory and odorant receptor 63a-like n=1 Tax=Zootermopsis nevadensis TaxID=136037 RepID=UPI000B8E6815|nr:gustatory and odorant receptor 63a-like [Zootermopsis nevadensis]
MGQNEWSAYALQLVEDRLKKVVALPVGSAAAESPKEVINGIVVFSWLSLEILYSVCVYLLLCFAVWFTNDNRMQAIRKANGRFEDSVDAYMLFVYLVPLAYLPFTHWRKANRMANYMNNWIHFQNLYLQGTGGSLVIPLKFHCLVIVFFAVALSPVSILVSYFFTTSSNNTVPEVFLYSYLATFSNLTGLFWYFICVALRSTAIRLEKSLFKTLDKSSTKAAVLETYRTLWLELSHLATDAGVAFCYTYGFYLLHLFFMLTLSTYATLSDIIVGTFGNNILVATCVFISGFMIFTMCEGANEVVLKTQVEFQQKLLRYQIGTDHNDVHREVNAFLQTITAQPPIISLGGYVRIDRQLLIGLGSTLVTYLIVLLQLKFTVGTT